MGWVGELVGELRSTAQQGDLIGCEVSRGNRVRTGERAGREVTCLGFEPLDRDVQ